MWRVYIYFIQEIVLYREYIDFGGNSMKSYTFGLISVSAKALKINKTIGETELRFNFISSTSATNMAARELW